MRKHFSIGLAALFMLFLAYSCTRKDTVTSPDLIAQNEPLTVANVRAWYEDRHASDIKAINKLKRAKNGSVRLSSYAKGAFAGIPDWSKSSSYFQNNPNGIKIALDYTRVDNDSFSLRELIVIRDKNGRLKEYVQKIEFDPQFFKAKRIANQPLLSPASKDFTGTVKLYNTSNFFIRGSIFKDGKLVGRILPKGGFNAGLTSSLGLGTKLLRTYGEIGTEKNPTEEEEIIIEVPIKDPEWPEIPPPGDPFPDPIDPPDFDPPYPGGGWGTGDGTTYVPPTNQPPQVKDSLKNFPCASEILSKLKNMNNEIGNLIKTNFVNSNMNNITFKSKDLSAENAYGQFTDVVRRAGNNDNFLGFDATIYLDNTLLDKASREMILAVATHEYLHAFLYLESQRLGATQFNFEYASFGFYVDPANVIRYKEDANHDQIGQYFFLEMKNLIKSYNPNLPDATAHALAFTGLAANDDIPADWRTLILNEVDVSKGKNKGTKCPEVTP